MRRRPGFLLALVASLGAAPAPAQLRAVTSTTDLYDIARSVGGERVRVRHISEGFQDPHFVEAKPSFVLELAKADVWAFVGLDLEIGWMSVLLDGARNPKIRLGGTGYLDVSTGIPVIDVPTGQVDRSQGDIHPRGNPHYWLDPANGARIARMFRDKFTELDPDGKVSYTANAQAFEASLAAAGTRLAPALAEVRGKPVVVWHTSWRYFAAFAGVRIVGYIEPKPGVPPSPSHLAGLILAMQRERVRAIVMEPFYDRKTADLVASKTGARVLVLPSSVGGVKGVDDYVALISHDVERLAEALR
jgi:ABC-type Zn uptake system ZnuABC Zn-binding protein ZnuA